MSILQTQHGSRWAWAILSAGQQITLRLATRLFSDSKFTTHAPDRPQTCKCKAYVILAGMLDQIPPR